MIDKTLLNFLRLERCKRVHILWVSKKAEQWVWKKYLQSWKIGVDRAENEPDVDVWCNAIYLQLIWSPVLSIRRLRHLFTTLCERMNSHDPRTRAPQSAHAKDKGHARRMDLPCGSSDRLVEKTNTQFTIRLQIHLRTNSTQYRQDHDTHVSSPCLGSKKGIQSKSK